MLDLIWKQSQCFLWPTITEPLKLEKMIESNLREDSCQKKPKQHPPCPYIVYADSKITENPTNQTYKVKN